MDCKLTEKISQFVDGELPGDERERMKQHLAVCSVCREAHEDFLRLRSEITSYEFKPDPFAQKRALENIMNSESVPLWKRRIAVPAPAFALLIIALISIVIWSALQWAEPQQTGDRIRFLKGETRAPETGLDLSRYDGGGRAVIYKTSRSQLDDSKQ